MDRIELFHVEHILFLTQLILINNIITFIFINN